MSLQLDLFVDPDAYIDKVISEEPYVKILGQIGWSPYWNCWAALAQVESSLCFVSLKLTELEKNNG